MTEEKRLVEVKEGRVKEKPSTLDTMFLSLVDKNQDLLNLVLHNFDISVVMDKDSCDITFHTDILDSIENGKPKIGQTYTVGAMATRDPTPCNAFGAVSLGFFRFFWGLKDAELKSLKPAIFRGWRRNYKNELLLELWE